jgi:hypothetical protein
LASIAPTVGLIWARAIRIGVRAGYYPRIFFINKATFSPQ